MDQIKRIRENFTYNQAWFFAILLPMVYLTPKMIHSWEVFNKFRRLERPDYQNANWNDFFPVWYYAVIIMILKYLCKLCWEEWFREKLSHKYEGENLEIRLHKSIKQTFKIFYFSFITALGFYVIQDTTFHSPMMFGEGNLMHLYSDWPYNRIPRYLQLYYMIGLSYHVEDTVHHLFVPAQNDFFEMLLHHYITIILIVGSYMYAHWNVGIIVMIQMDNGDIVAGLIKAIYDFAPAPIVLFVYLFVVGSWIYFRDIAYAYEVIWTGSMFGRWHFDDNGSPQFIYQWLLTGLLILNVYWTILFFRMGLRFIFKGEIKDLQNKIKDKKPSQAAKKKLSQ